MTPDTFRNGQQQLRRTLCLASLAVAYCVETAAAEIHDYMILRLIYLHTACGTESLQKLDSDAASRRFKVYCRNVSAYPDGLIVHCTDIDDDRACKIETGAKTFENLELLQPKR